jgi:8-oxo-dGTP diphosphatase
MLSLTPPANFAKRHDIVGCFIVHDGSFVVLHRYPHKAAGDRWGLPAGKMEKGENLEQAVIREIKEETGLTFSERDIKHYKSTYVREGPYDIEWHMFSAEIKERPVITVNPHEHSEFRWVTPHEALTMNLIHDLPTSIRMFFSMQS